MPHREDGTAPLAPHMSALERLCFEAAIAGRRHLVEFGCGGSTLLAVERGVGRIDSVDSDPAWIARLAGDPRLRPALDAGRLRLHHVDIGPVRDWGRPADTSGRARWPGYWGDVWRVLGRRGARSVDAVLVDGRFRAACILASVAHVRPGTPIIVHDFWNRPRYAPVMEMLLPVCRAETLAVFSPRAPVDRGRLDALLAVCADDPE